MSEPVPGLRSVRERRTGLSWSRAELAHRAGIDPRIVQLTELDQWDEPTALARIEVALNAAEDGRDEALPPVQVPDGAEKKL